MEQIEDETKGKKEKYQGDKWKFNHTKLEDTNTRISILLETIITNITNGNKDEERTEANTGEDQ